MEDAVAPGALSEAQVALIKRRVAGIPLRGGMAELGRMVGASYSTMNKIVHRRRGVSPALLRRLAEALAVPLAQLADPEGFATGRPPGRSEEPPGPPWNAIPVEDAMPEGIGRLPVYRWGSCGDPTNHSSEDAPIPDHDRWPPVSKASLIGAAGFAVQVRGDSMRGRGIDDGDFCWVNPKRPPQLNQVVAALVTNGTGDSGLVVKTLGRDAKGEFLVSQPAPGARVRVECQSMRVLGPVVAVTREFTPN